MILAFFHGFLLAFSLILPLGVQNVFVFTQGAVQPRFSGAIPVIITASLCDTLLITLAVTGVSVLVLTFQFVKLLLMAGGVVFLLYMGWVYWHMKTQALHSDQEAVTIKKSILFAMSVSLLNPHAILDTVGVIGTSSLAYQGMEKIGFTLACIGVSWFWFFLLALLGRIVRRLDTAPLILKWLQKGSAIVMWLSAAFLATL
ncbi:MAG: LysE family transporter [Sporomusaceae bacterium]|nr:LysE family transporter [Sporomusaceae bacterium]